MKVTIYFKNATEPKVEVDYSDVSEEYLVNQIKLLRSALTWLRRERRSAAKAAARKVKTVGFPKTVTPQQFGAIASEGD